MRPAALVLAFLLLAPAAWGASTSDPAGDEYTQTNPTAVIGTPQGLPCHDPRVDITNVEVTSDGENATVRLEVLDWAGVPECGGRPLRSGGGVRGGWWVNVLNDTTRDGFVAFAYMLPNGTLRFSYTVQNGTEAPDGALLASGRSGNVLTWTLPLSGTVPTYHNYKNRVLEGRASASEYVDWPSVLRFSDFTAGFEVRT